MFSALRDVDGQIAAHDHATVEIDDLYRFFRAGDEETLALKGVSAQCVAGDITVVMGPSGSGKSTLLACVAGLDEPSGGAVRISGTRMSHISEAQRSALRARHIGVIQQSGNLLDHLRVIDNVRLAAAVGPPRRRVSRSPGDLLERVGLQARARAWPQQLSGGEAARASLAVAMANGPSILVADEPTGELDSASEARMLGLIRVLADEGAAVLIASHSPAVAAAADVVIRLRDGVRQ